MGKSYRKIFYILIIVILLPVLFFTVYEILSLNQTEEVIEDIYKNQLETILFSLNQYTEDVISSWVEEVNTKYHISGMDNLLRDKPGLSCIHIKKTGDNFDFISNCDNSNIVISDIAIENKENLKKLYKLYKGNYRKIQPIEIKKINTVCLFFLIDHFNINESPILVAFEIDSKDFIKDILSPRVQATTQDQFIVSVFSSDNNQLIYSSINDTTYNETLLVKKNLWLLPGYEVGVSLPGETIDDVVKERTKVNLILVILLDFILIIGAIYLYLNIRREVKLTQIKSEFISNVSHEIRTPLALISMYIETLEMGRIKAAEKIQEYYNVISQETSRLSGMVNKILSFSKIESGRRKFNFEDTDLNDVMSSVLKSYKFHLDSKGFEYFVNLNNELPTITIDKEAIADSVINLIDNAIKYSNAEKYIEVRSGIKNDFLYIEVKDRGLGISKEKQKLIFDKFYRVTDGNLAHHAKGSGLGLAIVKSIIDAHQGKIEVESSPDRGSTFRLLLPKRLKK
ncbi:sensor histidine kinase [Bacteroidota bacterium]